MSAQVNSVMVIGYGTMGRGIVETFARNGFETSVLTRDPAKISDLPAKATAIADLPSEAPDLIIESIPEDMALKHALFARLPSQLNRWLIFRQEPIRPPWVVAKDH